MHYCEQRRLFTAVGQIMSPWMPQSRNMALMTSGDHWKRGCRAGCLFLGCLAAGEWGGAVPPPSPSQSCSDVLNCCQGDESACDRWIHTSPWIKDSSGGHGSQTKQDYARRRGEICAQMLHEYTHALDYTRVKLSVDGSLGLAGTMKLDNYAQLFLLLCFCIFHSSAIDTVNVVDFCGQTIRADGMIVNSHQQSKKYYFVTMGTDCHITMQASSPKDNIQFYFRFFLVYSLLRVAPLSPAPTMPEPSSNTSLEPISAESPADRCHAGSYIQFYDGPDKSSRPLGPLLCGKSLPRQILSTGNFLTLRLVTRGSQPRVDFVGDFTSFRLGFNQQCNGEPYFSCKNGKCIPHSLVCDDKGIDNCGDGSDLEENLMNECKDGQFLLPNSPPTTASPVELFNPPTTSRAQQNCAMPDTQGSTSAPGSWPLLLCIALGLLAGSLVFCWCCWSPGWFLWRVSICRFWPCCNSACSACQLCGGRTHCKEHRMAKVSPHPPPAKGHPTTTVNQAEETGTTTTTTTAAAVVV